MQFTPITQEELTVGLPIPWTLYNSAGDVILKMGAIPKSAEQINALVKSGAARNIDEQNVRAAATSGAARATTRALEQIKLDIGDSLQLQFQSISEHPRSFVTLIGYLVDQSVIVSTPMLNSKVMLIHEGQIFIVRLFSGKRAYTFTATTLKVSSKPFPHLHLSYPSEVHGIVVRGSSRARANIICHASTAQGVSYACIARDISIGGALIAVRERIGKIGDKLLLKLRMCVNGNEHVLILDCQIRSVNSGRPSAEKTLAFLHGLSFTSMSSQDTLVISSLLYQNLVSEKDADE